MRPTATGATLSRSSLAGALEAAHLATLGAPTGVVVLDPTVPSRRAHDYAGWLAGQQRVDRVMSRLAPPLFQSAAGTALVAGVVALVQGRYVSAAGRFAAAGCVVAAAAGLGLLLDR